MAAKRVNVLVYSGNGCTGDAVRHCIHSLRRLLTPNYAVMPIDGEATLNEPWTKDCALFVMPGGADLGYCRTLNGAGNRKIKSYVERGGAYFGFCAGAYYGSARCEFEEGNKGLEVVGDRELGFFSGVCRGLAFPGFAYNSEKGTRAERLKVYKESLPAGSVPELLRSYYNGGGVFVDAPKFKERGVEVLAEFESEPVVDHGEGKVAIVYCAVGGGKAILTSTHIEFTAQNLASQPTVPGYEDVLKALKEDESRRNDLLKACLLKLGLRVSEESKAVPSLTRLHLSSQPASDIKSLVQSWTDILTTKEQHEYIYDDNDTFVLEYPADLSLTELHDALPEENKTGKTDDDAFLDPNKALKRIVVYTAGLPDVQTSPYFNHEIYFTHLLDLKRTLPSDATHFGSQLLYGEVVTSTNTLLEKNTELLRRLPAGFTASATVQLAGRGRGSNVWVSPAGSLMFSTVVRHPASLAAQAPVIFLQYLAALAIVRGIKRYDKGYEDMPIKLKWPNDIYALDPVSKSYVKIGGILVNSHYNASEFLCVIGIGLNTTNAAPTTSLNALHPPGPFKVEKLLARILTALSEIYHRFKQTGFDAHFEDMYYQSWLHNDQIVTLEAEGGVRAMIKGITRDWGLLKAEQLGADDSPTGKIWELQSDSNSFDFFKGLLKRKM